MKKSRIALIALTTAAVLGASACGSDSGSDDSDQTATTSTSESGTAAPSQSQESADESSQSETESPADSDNGSAAVADAIDAAESETGGTAYEVDDENGYWEIDLAKDGKSIEVNVSPDGEVTHKKQENLDAEDRQGLEAAKVTISEGIEKALAEVDGTFDEAELEEENGSFYWEVEINLGNGQDRDVLVDVTTGGVTVQK